MAEEVAELSPLQEPGEITVPEAGSKYESYKSDSVYEYALRPNGRRPDKSRAKITYKYGDVYDGTDMISGVIKRSKDFTNTARNATNNKQKGNSANKGAAK